MGNRLSKIVTRTGDSGTTGLGDGSRVGKDSPRIDTLGELDELNSSIGVLLAEDLPVPCGEGIRTCLLTVQNHLFDLGGEICIPGHKSIGEDHVSQLEAWAEQYNADLPPLKEFILPGGTRPAALAHLSRTICRRAERSIVHLGHNEAVSVHARQYLNRLSDLLFVIGRTLNRAGHGTGDILWQHHRD
jgi:cob(I)alamin adenosyltransferase